MRTTLTLLCFLRIAYSAATAQSSDYGSISPDTNSIENRPLLADMYYPHLTPDSIRISFSQSPAAHRSAADGFYAIPEAYGSAIIKKKPEMGFMVLVRPATLFGWDSLLQITAHPELSAGAPYYEFRSAAYPYLNRHTVRQHEQEFRRIVYMKSLNDNEIFSGITTTSPGEMDTISFIYRDSTGRENRFTEYYVKYESFFDRTDSLMRLLDAQYQRYRTEVLQPTVTQLLTPFYISKIEIRNVDYRAFVRWVTDSIAFSILYDSLPPEQALELLAVTKTKTERFKQLHGRKTPIDPVLKEENLRFFGFDYHALDSRNRSFYGQELYYQYLDSFYYPTSARFYQRREIDVRKLIYRSEGGSPTPVYPDTLCWLRDSTYSAYDPMCNMYFWHPVYDNYPVVGLSEAQMQAYCHWLTRRRNEELENEDFTVLFTLPELYHYEMAVKASTIRSRVNTVDAYPDAPFIISRPVRESMTFVQRVFPPSYYHRNAADEPLRKFFDWDHMNQTFPIHYLSFGVSEYCSTDDSDSLMTVLGGNRYSGLVDPHENQLNTTFFQQTVPVSGGSSITGFRTIMYILPKR